MQKMVIIAVLLAALVGGASCDSRAVRESATVGGTASQSATIPELAKLDYERKLISLSKTKQSMTAVAFNRTSPPPWKRGNTLEFREIHPPTVPGGMEEQAIWRAVNIHAENLFEITRRLGIGVLEVQIVHRRQPSEIQETGRAARKIVSDLGYAVITDPRIPREWLLVEPKCEREIGRQMRSVFPQAFHRH